MPAATKPRRRNPTTAVPDRLAGLRPALQERLEAVRRGRYKMLGTIQSIRTPNGVLKFPDRSGPAVAESGERENQLLVVAPWSGLPAIRILTNEFCPDCLRTCDVCTEGKKLCEGAHCGGSGKLTDLATGKKTENDCPMCTGSGKMPCPVCLGQCKVSTGLKDGSTDYRDPRCESCRGLRFVGKDVEQSLDEFIQKDAQLEPMTVVGPIIRLVVAGIPGEPKTQIVFEVEPDQDGDLLVLLLEPTPAVTRAYLLGGILKERGGR